jgi:hypothetical protein
VRIEQVTNSQLEEDAMLSFLSKELREGLEAARKTEQRRKSRLRLQVGEAVFPILRMWEGGFALDATLSPHLRGLVDIYDGANHIAQCLIIASVSEGDEVICEYKRATAVATRAALDFVQDENAPIAYLPRA